MFDHVSVRVSDLPSAVGALGAGLRELGIEQTGDTPSFVRWGNFVLMQDNDDRPPTRRVHVAFIAKAQADVDRFWQAGVDAGLVDDGPAGPRPHYADDYYAGFLSRTLPATALKRFTATAIDPAATSTTSPSGPAIWRRQPRSTRRRVRPQG
jgi:hypothetical protein